MQTNVITLENKAAGTLDLADEIFGLDPRADILHRMVQYQLAKRRAGTHKVKNVSEVAGSGAKPFRQKGTGRARQGQRRAHIRYGGATMHGPTPRSHAIGLNKKVRKLALKNALSARQKEGKLIVLDSTDLGDAKTRNLAGRFAELGWTSVLIIDGQAVNENFAQAARNLPRVDVLPQQGANVYDILRHETLVLTKAAVEGLEARLK
ncbi:50S ribosomal protein L4 [Oceanibacterium hippocampi]